MNLVLLCCFCSSYVTGVQLCGLLHRWYYKYNDRTTDIAVRILTCQLARWWGLQTMPHCFGRSVGHINWCQRWRCQLISVQLMMHSCVPYSGSEHIGFLFSHLWFCYQQQNSVETEAKLFIFCFSY